MQRRRFIKLAAGGAASLRLVQATATEKRDILVGQTAVLSGPLGTPIQLMNAGAQLAFAEAESRLERRIRLVSLDDGLKPDVAVSNMRRLLDEHRVLACFGCVGSANLLAAQPLLRQHGAAVVAPFAVTDSARETLRGVAYHLRAGAGREAQALMQHLATIGLRALGIAYLDLPAAQEVRSSLEQLAQHHGMQLLANVAVRTDGSNASAAGRELASASPQAVVMYVGGALGADVLRSMKAANAGIAAYGLSIVPGDLIARLLGAEARGLAIAQVVPYPWDEADATRRRYRELAAKAGVEIGYNSFEGYLNGRLLVEALRAAGPQPARESLHPALRALKFRLAGMDIDFGRDGHTASRLVELVQLNRQGRYVR